MPETIRWLLIILTASSRVENVVKLFLFCRFTICSSLAQDHDLLELLLVLGKRYALQTVLPQSLKLVSLPFLLFNQVFDKLLRLLQGLLTASFFVIVLEKTVFVRVLQALLHVARRFVGFHADRLVLDCRVLGHFVEAET